MQVIEISSPGGPEVLQSATRPVPVPSHGQVLIRVAYAGVNRPDALQRAGSYLPPPGSSDLPGLEAAGTIAALGAGVSQWSVGEPVCALLPGGGYAEYALAPAAHCLPIPRDMGLREAACLPETTFTVWSNVMERGRLAAGELLLLHGGASGIGTTAIQIARLHGARVFVTAGSEEKCRVCRELGAERAIAYRNQDFVEIVQQEGGADVILDMVGGSYIERNLKALAEDGRLVQIAFLQSPKATLNLARMMMKRQTITGSTLRPQSDLAKARIARAVREHVWPHCDAGRVAPVMDETFDLKDAARAHARMEANQHIGKMVLKVRKD